MPLSCPTKPAQSRRRRAKSLKLSPRHASQASPLPSQPAATAAQPSASASPPITSQAFCRAHAAPPSASSHPSKAQFLRGLPLPG